MILCQFNSLLSSCLLIILFIIIGFVSSQQQQQQRRQITNANDDTGTGIGTGLNGCSTTTTTTTTTNNKQVDNNNVCELPVANKPTGAAGYLLASGADQEFNQTNEIDLTLSNLLNKNGPDMQPLRDFTDSDGIVTLNVAKRAWKLMRNHAKQAVVDKLKFVSPLIEQTLKDSNVSFQCLESALKTMEAAQSLESWAIQLLGSWGNFPPIGIYEGTFGDIGSFNGCVNVPENKAIGHAHYCTISYKPVLPSRRQYELIVRKEPDELLKLFSEQDAFTDLLKNTQYNHYIYYKFGTCFPIKCTPIDVQRLAKFLGRRSILMTGPVKCHSKFEDDYQEEIPTSLSSTSGKNSSTQLQISTRDLNDGVYIWKPHMTQTQLVSLIIVCTVTAFIVLLTLVDVAFNRAPKLWAQLFGNPSSSSSSLEAEDKKTADNDYLGPKIGIKQQQVSNDNMYTSARDISSQISSQNSAHDLPSAKDETSLYTANHDNNNKDSTTSYYELNYITKVESSLDSINREPPGNCEYNNFKTTIPVNYDDDDYEEDRVVNYCKLNGSVTNHHHPHQKKQQQLKQKHRSLFMDIVDDYSIITNVKQFFRVSQSKNDILCINGIRCITMSWIIITHTMQYNDWSAFARTREIETHLKSLFNQPLFNASYLVDSFFLISGLLTSYSTFSKSSSSSNLSSSNNVEQTKQQAKKAEKARLLAKFSSRAYLIGRYLRLTPQIMFVSMLFILLPQLTKNGGPHWYTITGGYSENCSQNWWINLFHLQAFYRSNEMCNFVCWWISVDMFYHLFAIGLILLTLYYGHLCAQLSCFSVILIYEFIQAGKHYQLLLPPNLLSTIPQTGAMWSKMTLEFFWTPYAHGFPFFSGFYLGYLIAQKYSKLKALLTFRRALLGWSLAISCLLLVSYSTYFWVIGKWQYSRLEATLFHLISTIIWSTCLGWIIIACQLGYGSWINQILSCKLFIILGKASYVVYLSHFLVLFTFFGSQNLLLEPTQLVMLYVILGNICLSMLFGSFICIVYEMPWLKTQKRLMKYVR